MKTKLNLTKIGLMMMMGLVVATTLLWCGVSKADDNLPTIDPLNIPNNVTITYDKANPADIVNTKMIINAPDKTIMNFSSFNIGKDYMVDVKLPNLDNGSLASFLARDIGGNASNINGTLNCNGLFILTNVNGINIGSGANINVGSLILSTRDITNTNFVNANYIFEKQLDQQTDRLLLNRGTITISEGGFGVLIAGAIDNQGIIVCPMGTIALAGGDAVRLDISNNKLISIAIDKEVADTIYDYEGNPITKQLNNTGTITANGSTVIFHAEALPGIFEKAINMEGYVKADRAVDIGGTIKLISDTGTIALNGEMTADDTLVKGKKVVLEGLEPTYLHGDMTLYNFECTTPGKYIYFEGGHTYTFKDTLNIIGSYDAEGIGIGAYVHLHSSEAGNYWYLNVEPKDYTINLVDLKDAYALSHVSVGLGEGHHIKNISIDPEWKGGGTYGDWSESANWVGGAIPGEGSDVVIDSGDQDSRIDAMWWLSHGQNGINSLTIGQNYSGKVYFYGSPTNFTLTINNSLTIAAGKTLQVNSGCGIAGGSALYINNSGTIIMDGTLSGLCIIETAGSWEFSNPDNMSIPSAGYANLTLSDPTETGDPFVTNGDITVDGTLTITGTTLDMGESTLMLGADINNGGTIITGSLNLGSIATPTLWGSWQFTDPSNVGMLPDFTYVNLALSGSGTYYGTPFGAQTVTVTSTLDIASGTTLSVQNLNNTGGDLINSGTISLGGTATLNTVTTRGSWTFPTARDVPAWTDYATLTLSGGAGYTAAGSITCADLVISNGNVTFAFDAGENLTISGGATGIDNSGTITFNNGSLSISPITNMGNWNFQTARTVLNTTAYNTLNLSATTGTYVISGVVGVSGLTLGAGASLDNSAGTLYISSGTLTGLPSSIGGKVIYTATRTLPAVTNYTNLSFSNGQTFTAAGIIAVSGTLTISNASDVLDMGNRTLTVTTTLSNSGTIQDAGSSSSFPSNTVNGTFKFTSAATTIPALTYGKLNLSSATTYNAAGTITLTNGSSSTLTIATGATLNAGGTINMNNNTLKLSGSTSVLDMTKGGTQNYTLTAGSATFNNSGTIKIGSAMPTIPSSGSVGAFEFTSSNPTIPVATYTTLTIDNGATVSGSVTITATTLAMTGALSNTSGLMKVGTATGLSGSVGAFEFTSANPTIPAATYTTLTIDNGATVSGSVIATALTVSAGTLDNNGTITMGSSDLKLTGATLDNTDGTLIIGDGTLTSFPTTVKGLIYFKSDNNRTLPASEIYTNLQLGRTSSGGPTQYTMGSGSTVNGTLTVDNTAQLMLTITGTFSVSDKTYDGSNSATISVNNLSLSGLAGGYSSVSLTAVATFSDQNASPSAKTVSITSSSSISGTNASKYTLSVTGAPTTTAKINTKELTVLNITAANKYYDGTTAATLNTTSAALDGVIIGDTDNVTLDKASAVGTFSSAAIGNNKTVTISGLTISGSASTNYSLTQPTTTANILAAPSPSPSPTPTPDKVSHATQETNVVIDNSVTRADSTLNANEVRIQHIQQGIAAYAAAIQRIMVPPSAVGLKVIMDGQRIYIGQ